MSRFRLTVGNRILGGFLLLILVFIINAIIVSTTLRNTDKSIQLSSEVINPTVDGVKDMILLVTRSKMLITNWVYLQSNVDDKEALKELQNSEYPEIKAQLQSLSKQWNNPAQQAALDTIIMKFEALLEVEKMIMSQLVTFDDYEDPSITFMSVESIEIEVLPMTTEIISRLEDLAAEKQQEADLAQAKIMRASRNLIQTTILLTLIIVVLGVIAALFVARSITNPVNAINQVIKKLGTGELADADINTSYNDELKEMSGAMSTLVSGLKNTSQFAERIGDGKYDSAFTPLSDKDILGNALIEMRDNLQKVAEEDKQRNWTTNGIAQFSELLRTNINDMEQLSAKIMSSLVKYLDANQGGLFIVADEKTDDDEPYMYLAAAYAWDKRKYVEQKVLKGEGLSGQAWLEGDTVYITEVPDNYVRITSGLGMANPTAILIVPLKLNDEIYGVIELASFNEFRPFEIEFVEKIAESIASSISSVKINAQTTHLLKESQEMTDRMKAQEEEMRQNMEELVATQEEMQRSQRSTEDKEKLFNRALMNFELNQNFQIVHVNENSTRVTGFQASDLENRPFPTLLSEPAAFQRVQDEVSNGQPWSGNLKLITRNGNKLDMPAAAGKVVTENGTSKYLIYGFDASTTVVEA